MKCVNYFEKKVNIQEAICLMEAKINEIVEMYNRVNADHEAIAAKVKELEALIDYLLGAGLAAEVKKQLEVWLADGTLADIIGDTLDKWTVRITKLETEKQDKKSYIVYLDEADGVTGDEKFANAINALPTGGAIYIGEDVEVTTPKVLNPGTRIIGLGKGKITLKGTGTIVLRNECKALDVEIENILEANGTTGGRDNISILVTEDENGSFDVEVSGCRLINGFHTFRMRDNVSTTPATRTPNGIVRFTNNYCKTITNQNAGNVMVQTGRQVIISDNIVDGGKTSSAIGISIGSELVIVSNNIVTNNKEASIQIENFEGRQEVLNGKVIVESNICDGAIWCHDTGNVKIHGNTSDTVRVTCQSFETEGQVISNNTTGNIWLQSMYVTPEGRTARLKSVIVQDNTIIGANGYWDEQPTLGNAHAIFCSGSVKEVYIKDNVILNQSLFGQLITITRNKDDHMYYFNGGNHNKLNEVGALGKKKILNSNGVLFNKVSKAELPTTIATGLEVAQVYYVTEIQEYVYYKNSTDKWCKFSTGQPME